jgi:hypothetical protein
VNNVTLLDTQPVPAIPVPGPVELAFTASAWTPTQVNVSYTITQTSNVVFPNGTSLQYTSGVNVPDRATPIALDTRFELRAGTTPRRFFEVHAEVFDRGAHQFEVAWVIEVKP